MEVAGINCSMLLFLVDLQLWQPLMTCIGNCNLLRCRKKNSCMITLYKNGYQMEGKDFCKKEEHKEFYQSLIDGFVFSYSLST